MKILAINISDWEKDVYVGMWEIEMKGGGGGGGGYSDQTVS